MDGRDRPDHDNPGFRAKTPHTARAGTPRARTATRRRRGTRRSNIRANGRSATRSPAAWWRDWLMAAPRLRRTSRTTMRRGRQADPGKITRPEAGGGNQHQHRAELRHRSRRVQRDPYPTFARLRSTCPIAYVPQLGSTLLTRRDDIFVCEEIDVFHSRPAGRPDEPAHGPQHDARTAGASGRARSSSFRLAQDGGHGGRSFRPMPTGSDGSRKAPPRELCESFCAAVLRGVPEEHHRPHQHRATRIWMPGRRR